MPQHVVASHYNPNTRTMTQEYTNWLPIGEKLRRVPNECSNKWQLLQNAKLNQGPFNAEEDALIRQRVEEWGDRKNGLWVNLQHEMGRPSVRIRQRWVSCLSKR